MKINNDINQNNQSFTSLLRHSIPCQELLLKNFENNQFTMDSALEALKKRCSAHKHFDLFLDSSGEVRILGKTQKGSEYVERHSDVMNYPKNLVYSNKLDRVIRDIDYLSESDIAPKNIIEKLTFKIFSWGYKLYGKTYVNLHPYEKLPPNVRAAVDFVEMTEKSF